MHVGAATMALIMGYYGSMDLVADPGSSRLVQASSFLVQDITVRILGKEEEVRSEENGVVLYGLTGAPRLDVPAEWSEARRVVVPANSHREILSSLFGPCAEGSRPSSAADHRALLLTTTSKEEEEDTSLGFSYDSVSGDDNDGVEVEGRRLCVVCCNARRDCFFLPCGHSATCLACGTRILEGDDGSCPLCQRKLKKVRRIFVV